MDNTPSRNDEKGQEQAAEKGRKDEQDMQWERDLATEKGRKDEQNMQRERDLATEKGRKQGVEEERIREKQKRGRGTGANIVIFLIALVLIIVVAGFLTLSVSITDVPPGNTFPFSTHYGVSFPEGQTITVGNSKINVLSYQNELISDIDGERQKLVVGENRVISERRAVITSLGAITLMDTNFQINLVYKGDQDNRAFFDMAVQTSRQVPDMLVRQLLPPEIDAQPI